ncbi:hypothetical protein GCM10027440_08850 [Nocardiopsis coralliicola]
MIGVQRRIGQTAALCVVLLAGGCAAGSGDSGGEEPAGAESPSASEPTEGGPVGNADFEVRAVKTEAVAPDTVELATRAEPTDGAGDVPNAVQEGAGEEQEGWEPRFTLTFHSAVHDGDVLEVQGEAAYRGDTGGYVLHSDDLSVQPAGGVAESPEEIGDDPPEPVPAADEGALAKAEAGGAPAPFTVRFPDAPRSEGGRPVPMVVYTTPDELWGHATDDDWKPGRVCYQEGEQWHEMPLFAYTDVPCG